MNRTFHVSEMLTTIQMKHYHSHSHVDDGNMQKDSYGQIVITNKEVMKISGELNWQYDTRNNLLNFGCDLDHHADCLIETPTITQ